MCMSLVRNGLTYLNIFIAYVLCESSCPHEAVIDKVVETSQVESWLLKVNN